MTTQMEENAVAGSTMLTVEETEITGYAQDVVNRRRQRRNGQEFHNPLPGNAPGENG